MKDKVASCPMIAQNGKALDSWLEGLRRVAVVVAHPDDETLWAGGLLLSHLMWAPSIVSLCRGNDPDRAPRFHRAMTSFNAQGIMGELDDEPEQVPLPDAWVQDAVLSLLPARDYELLLTHSPRGEYTRHRRHEEISRAVMALWQGGKIRLKRLWQFAYEDGGGTHAPLARRDADIQFLLPTALWSRKSSIITDIYGFRPTSWEARTVPHTEAFHEFSEDNSLISTPLTFSPPAP
jgi:LmbE family N-acetylglucosaminyl deacetylase